MYFLKRIIDQALLSYVYSQSLATVPVFAQHSAFSVDRFLTLGNFLLYNNNNKHKQAQGIAGGGMSWASWLQAGVAAIAGTAEPVYGDEAIHSITKTVTPETAYSTLDPEDYKWVAPERGSNVETQTFYVTTETGHLCFAQIIHSNPSGLQYTAQFTCRIFNPSKPEENVWTSTTLEDFSVLNDEKRSFTAKGVSITLSDDYKTYSLKITVKPETIVDFKVTRDTPAFKIGRDGYTIYGPDTANPWGTMRHLFWPRCTVSGVILVHGVPLKVDGRGLFIHALQGMKPHHAAAKWNFANFQGETISATMMEFTTPESYGSTVVNVGGITRNNEILAATVRNEAVHVESQIDPETSWPEPTSVKYSWQGVTAPPQGPPKPISATIEKKLGARLERVDVLAEIPPWLKKIAHGVSGTKPFIYQFQERVTISLTIGSGEGVEEVKEEGTLFVEATFIS